MRITWSLPVRGERLTSTRGDLVRARRLIAALRALGHTVEVVESEASRGSRGAVSGYRKHVRRLLTRPLALVVRDLGRVVHGRAHGRRVARAAAAQGADLIIETQVGFSASGAIASELAGVPLLLDDCSPSAEEEMLGAGLAAFAHHTLAHQARQASGMVAVTSQLRDRLAAEGLPVDRVSIVPNGVDLEEFTKHDREAVRRRLGLEDRTVVGYVGSFQPWHRVDLLVAAVASLVDRLPLTLLLIGDGMHRPEVEALCRERAAASDVRLLGSTPHERIPELLSAVDVAVMPGTNDYGHPMKLLEYAASGAARLAPDVATVRDMITDGVDGLLFAAGDADALADGILTLASDRNLRRRLGDAGRAGLTGVSWCDRARTLCDAGAMDVDRDRGDRKTRRPVAIVVSRFPKTTETFVLRELIQLERLGQPIRLVSLLRGRAEVVHPDALAWMERAQTERTQFTPFLSAAIAAENLRRLARMPLAYLAILGRILVEMIAEPRSLVRALALFPKSVYLARLLEEQGVRHVHGHFATYPALCAYIVSRLTPLTYSFTAHAHDIFVHTAMLSEKIRRARFVRAISEFNRDYLADRFPHARDKTKVGRLGVDLARHRPGSGAGHEVCDVLCVAALEEKKGHEVLLEALHRLRQRGITASCQLIGDGPLRRRIETAIARLGLTDHVQLTGAVPETEVARRMRASRVVVLPSVIARDGRMEGIPVVLMEAMACARAVVASALSGVPELITHGENGLLVQPGDPIALADDLGDLLERPERRAQLGARARATIESRFQLSSAGKRLLDLLDRHNPPWRLAPAESSSLARVGGALGIRQVHRSRDAEIVELVAGEATSQVELVLKRHLSRPGESRRPRERARREHEMLRALWRRAETAPAAATPLLTVPRPLMPSGDLECVLMEKAPGVRLDRLIRRLRWQRDALSMRRLEDLVESCGRWLSWFQGLPLTLDPWEPVSPFEVLERELEQTGGGDRLPTWLARLIGDYLDTRCRSAGAGDCAVHSDYWLGNVLVDGDDLRVIDFEGVGVGPRYHDAGYFLVQLTRLLAYPGLSLRLQALRESFLRGFQRAGIELDQVALLRASAGAASRFLVAEARVPPTPGRRWVRRKLRAIVEEAIKG